MKRTRILLVPFAYVAIGLVVVLSGCGKQAEEKAIPPNSPAAYMNDPVFRKAFEDKRKELLAIVNERRPLADRMQALVKEHGEDLAVLQKLPEWNELYKKVTALNGRHAAVRQQQLALLRERMTPPASKDISK